MSRRVLVALCLALFLPRGYLAFSDQGMVWSDEIFQTLEQGHRLAFGYGLVPWEFREGARSWLLPAVLAAVMKVLAVLGVKTGLGLAVGIKLLFAGLAAATFYPLLRMCEELAGGVAVLLAAALAVFFPALLLYGSRAMAETATAPLLVWGIWLLWPFGMGGAKAEHAESARRGRWSDLRRLGLAGALFGLATVLRYQLAVAIAPILVIVALRHRFRAALWVSLATVVVFLAGGVLDWVTWGRPFQSLIVYLRFNLLENGANRWGVAKASFYWETMLHACGPGLLVLLAGCVAGLARTWKVALPVLVFVLAHSAIAHKELRFLYPVLPLLLACAAIGLGALIAKLPLGRARPWFAVAGVVALPAAFAVRAKHLTFADIGQPMAPAELSGLTSPSIWGAFDERNRLFSHAGAQADLCGLAEPGINPYWTGGYTYFHHRAPIVWSEARPDLEAANYVLLGPDRKMPDPRYHPVAQRGPYVLYRRDGVCGRASLAGMSYGRLSPVGVP